MKSSRVLIYSLLFITCVSFLGCSKEKDNWADEDEQWFQEYRAKIVRDYAGTWEPALSNCVLNADSIEIIQVANQDGQIIKDKEEIESLVRSIRISEEDSHSRCSCSGEQWLTFKNGTNELVTISVHHGAFSLRWKDGEWPADGILTTESRSLVRDWLSEKGIELME